MVNFKCKSCKKEHTISNFSIVIRNENKFHVQAKTHKPLLCDCKKKGELEYIGEFGGFGTSVKMSKQQMQSSLKKRSKEHFKKEINEQKYEKNKQLIKKFQQ